MKQNVTVLTYEISEETVINIAIAILEEAEDDEVLYQLVQAYCDYMNGIAALQAEAYGDYYDYYEPAYFDADEIFEQIPDAIEELEDMDPNDDTAIVIETYVDSKGNICGRSIEAENADTTISYYTAIKGKKIGMLAEMESYGESIRIEGSGTIKKDSIVTGELAFEVFGDEYAIIDLDGFDIKAYTGTLRFKLGADAVDLLEEQFTDIPVGTLLNVSDLAVEVTLNTGSVKIGLVSGKKALVTATLSGSIKEGGEASVPKDTVDVEDTEALEEWINNLDMDALADLLEEAGLPDEIVEMVRETDPMELIESMGAQAVAPDYNYYY